MRNSYCYFIIFLTKSLFGWSQSGFCILHEKMKENARALHNSILPYASAPVRSYSFLTYVPPLRSMIPSQIISLRSVQ